MGKILTGKKRLQTAALVLSLAVLVGVVAALLWREPGSSLPPPPARPDTQIARAPLLNEPRSFNRLVTADAETLAVSWLVHAPLVTLDPRTFEVIPVLAERWTRSPDGRRWTITLRQGVRFSDNTPFTSADVAFTFDAIYDERTASPLAGALQVDGQPLQVEAADPHTVVLTASAPLGAGLRTLADVPILPKHKLQGTLDRGQFRKAWNIGTPPSEIVGLGPFVLADYRPGERLRFHRNPRYFRRDASGRSLPYLKALVVDIVPDQNAEVLRLFAGDSDMMFGALRPEDLPEARRLVRAGRLSLHDAGVGLSANFLWFNLIPGANPHKSWLRRLELRQAVSLAVDRQAFADTVYRGEGVPMSGPVTPGNRTWLASDLPVPRPDPARAREKLASIGLHDRDGDGLVETAAGRQARIVLLTQKGSTPRERGASVIQQDLRAIGLTVSVVALDQAALIDRLLAGRYEAIYFGAIWNDTDPASTLDFWLSRGAFHAWHPGQRRPATEWEAEIDRLMLRQAVTLDPAARKRIFDRVQHIFADNVPALFFAAPRLTVATSARVRNITPGPLHPYCLWHAAAIQLGGTAE
ncbi:MAG: ABC transporter substrate-binding protein [Vicinamibacteraceae bacterium]